MKVIKPYSEILKYDLTKEGILNHIERIARICYKSEDKMTEPDLERTKRMVGGLIKRKHTAMLEHASLCFQTDADTYWMLMHQYNKFEIQSDNSIPSMLRFSYTDDGRELFYISGNLRAWLEFINLYYPTYNPIVKYLDPFVHTIYELTDGLIGTECDDNSRTALVDPAELPDHHREIHQTITVLFHVDRGVTHELVRHRLASFAQESTRYCNYSQGKFGSDITVIDPSAGIEIEDKADQNVSKVLAHWKMAMKDAEHHYMKMLKHGATPQMARSVLPQSTKADIVVTANIAEWRHILKLRAAGATGKPHPQMLEVMVPLLRNLKIAYPTVFSDIEPMCEEKKEAASYKNVPTASTKVGGPCPFCAKVRTELLQLKQDVMGSGKGRVAASLYLVQENDSPTLEIGLDTRGKNCRSIGTQATAIKYCPFCGKKLVD